MELVIREAVSDDAEEMAVLNSYVHTLHVDAEPDVYRPIDPAVVTERMREELTSGSVRAWLALDDRSRPVGMVRAREVTRDATMYGHARHFVEVDELSVAPAARRTGAGRQLMAAAEGWAGQLGVEVRLSCRSFNDGAQRFYASLGYEPMLVRYRKR